MRRNRILKTRKNTIVVNFFKKNSEDFSIDMTLNMTGAMYGIEKGLTDQAMQPLQG
jgi:hypothetical protein